MRRKFFIGFFLFVVWVILGTLLAAQLILMGQKGAFIGFLIVWILLLILGFRLFKRLP